MNEEWWESPVCWVCDYWWALLLALVLGLSAFFTRDYWLPLLGVTPEPVLGTGDIQATLTWDSTNDLDLWVTDPAGATIFFGSPNAPSGGQLDVDANADCEVQTTRPVENIFWPTGGAPRGDFVVQVQYYKQCEAGAPIAFHLRLKVDGKVTEYDGVINAAGDLQKVTAFTR